MPTLYHRKCRADMSAGARSIGGYERQARQCQINCYKGDIEAGQSHVPRFTSRERQQPDVFLRESVALLIESGRLRSPLVTCVCPGYGSLLNRRRSTVNSEFRVTYARPQHPPALRRVEDSGGSRRWPTRSKLALPTCRDEDGRRAILPLRGKDEGEAALVVG